jgi:hypothetical protein
MPLKDWLGALLYVAVAAAAIGGAGLLTDALGAAATGALTIGVPPRPWP